MVVHFDQGTFQQYVSGYRQAAQHLSARLMATDPNNRELIYPLIFLYRHFIELQLKSIIKDARSLLCLEGGFPQHHRLRDLWQLAKELLLRLPTKFGHPAGAYRLTQNIQDINIEIAELNSLDPKAVSFRYPGMSAANGRLGGGEFIDAEDLSRRMGSVIENLFQLDLVCSLLLEYQEQIAAVYGGDA